MERIFFVDYENVDTSGLDGLTRLTGNDKVYIYYSERHSRMTFGLHRRLMETKAGIEYRKIQDASKNALDNELMREADGIIADKRADYYIISKDKGYESFIQKKKEYRVFLLADIRECNAVKIDWLKRVVRARLIEDKKKFNKTYKLSDQEIDKIARWIMDATSKQELNKHLQEMFYSEDVGYIFTRLRDLTYNL